MHLAYSIKNKPGKWEVRWTWFPFFLAADSNLVHTVDEALTLRFVGLQNPTTPEEEKSVLTAMDAVIIETIMAVYPIEGLNKYLEALTLWVEPDNDTEETEQGEAQDQHTP